MYNKKTSRGWEIVSTLRNNKGLFIVVKRINDYAWGSYYDEESGNWVQGHYGYSSQESAEKDMVAFALDVKVIPQDDKGLNEALTNFADYVAKKDLQECREEADRYEFIEDMKHYFEDEIDMAWKEYLELSLKYNWNNEEEMEV